MAFSDYQQTIAWHSALELGPKLSRLAEELPVGEQNGLSQALLNLAIDLPTSIGIDIQTGGTTRNAVLVKLQTALELTARIYPALDTVVVENALADRIERFTGPSFNETISTPPTAITQAEDPIDEVEAIVDQPLTQPIVQAPELQPIAPINPPVDTSGTHISLTPLVVTEPQANVPTNIQQ